VALTGEMIRVGDAQQDPRFYAKIETAQLVEELRRHRDQLLEESAQLWKEVEGRFSTQHLIRLSLVP
jgi:hypothetical protein